MSEPAPLPPVDRRIVLVLTALVLWFGVVKVLDSHTPEPAPVPTAEEPATPDDAEPIEIGTPAEAGWTLTYSERLSPTKLSWTDLLETNEDGRERPYEGKLTLRFTEGMSEAWPIIDGQVVVEPRPAYLRAMVDTGTVEVEFKGHDPVVRRLPWIVAGSVPVRTAPPEEPAEAPTTAAPEEPAPAP